MDIRPSLREKLGDADESVRAFAAEDAGFDDRGEDVATLVERLREERSRHVRQAIVAALSRMTHVAVCEHAIALLGSDDPYLRNAAVAVLQTRGEIAVERLERAYPGANAAVRKLLLDTVSGIPGERAERVLLLGLADEDVNVRIAAVEYLGERRRPDLKHHFEALARDEHVPMLLSTALAALEEVGDAASWEAVEQRQFGPEGYPPFLAPQLLRVMAKCAPESALDRFFAEGARLGSASLPDWLDALETLHQRFHFRALSPAQFDTLRAVFARCDTPLTRMRLLKWAGCLDLQPRLVPMLDSAFRSDEPLVRQGAALGLSHVRTSEAYAALSSRLPLEADDDVRAAIVAALAAEPGAVP
jgi:HEAT repeat protein